MLDVKNPEIRVDEIMQRIQEKVRNRREARAAAPNAISTAELEITDWQSIDEQLARAQQTAMVGAYLPQMTRMRGLQRAVSGMVAKVFLRVAQLITRDQREFNVAVVDILRMLCAPLRSEAAQFPALRADLDALRAELSSVRAELSEAQARVSELPAAETRARGSGE